jgi:hypothetical protein
LKFAYQAEKFATARRSLMLPHPKGEVQSITDAFIECSHGLKNLRSEDLDDSARCSVRKLKELMDSSGLEDPTHRGWFAMKAEQLTLDQKFELSEEINYLATWFDLQTKMANV